MNDLFLEWDANGIDIGFYPQSDIQAESPVYADAMLAAKYGLALLLCAGFGVAPKPIIAQIASSSYNRIQRDAQVAKQGGVNMTTLGDSVDPTTS